MQISGKELREWITEHDLLMKLNSDGQAQLIIDNFYEAGFELGVFQGNLVQAYTDETGVHTNIITLDDVIDMAVENYYELHNDEILRLKEKLATATNLGTSQTKYSFIKDLRKLIDLEKKYAQLLHAFEQTCYGRDLKRQQSMQDEKVNTMSYSKRKLAAGR